MMPLRIAAEISLGQVEQSHGRPTPRFLNVNKGSGQLYESLIKRAIGLLAFRQPELLQHFVSFKEQLPIEAVEVSEIMAIQPLVAKGGNHFGNLEIFLTHVR